MKRLRKGVSAALAVLVMAAMSAGCGKPSENNADVTSKAVSESSSGTTNATAGMEPITFTMKSVSPDKDWELKDTPIGQKIIEKTGVNIKFEFSVGDENQNIALMIASNDLPDIVCPHYNVKPFISAGYAVELTDLIEKYAPIYKKALEAGNDWNAMKWSKEDPGRYFFARPSGGGEQFDQLNWFLLQHAVVIDQGYPVIKTLDQFGNAIKQYMEKYPKIDGQPTIGLSMDLDGWRWILSLTNPAMMAAGTQSSGEIYVDPATQKVSFRILQPEEKEYFRWLNDMYNKGILDKEAFTQTYDQYKAKIATGRVLAVTDMSWTFMEATQNLKKEGKFDRLYGSYPLVVREGVENSSFSGPRSMPSPAGEMLISPNCKNPERFLELVNYLMSDEGQILINWGIEGAHYDVVDGKRVFRQEERDKRNSDPDYTIKTGLGAFLAFTYQDGVKAPDGQYYTINNKENVTANYTDVDKQVLSAYGLTTWADWFKKPDDFTMRPWPNEGMVVNKISDDDIKAIYNKLEDIDEKDVVKAVMAKPGNFDAAWDEMVNELQKAGMDKFNAACEQIIKDQVEIYNSGK